MASSKPKTLGVSSLARADRAGKINVTGYFDPSVKAAIRLLQSQQPHLTQQDLLAEALHDLMVKYGLRSPFEVKRVEPDMSEQVEVEPDRSLAAPPPLVSKSTAHRIGTVLDPYVRADGAAVRPFRVTMPVELIEELAVLATRQRTKTAIIVQRLVEEYVRAHSDDDQR